MKRLIGRRVVLLGAAGILLLTVTAYANPQEFQQDDKKRCAPKVRGANFIEVLCLTGEQQAQLKKHREGHRTQMKELGQSLRKRRQELMKELEKSDSNKSALDTIVSDIVSIQKQLVERRVEKILQVKTVLTPEQFEKFNKVMQSKHGRGKRGGGGHRRGQKKPRGSSDSDSY